jgi:hypothetical protein
LVQRRERKCCPCSGVDHPNTHSVSMHVGCAALCWTVSASLRWLSTPTSLALPAFIPHCHLHLIDVFFWNTSWYKYVCASCNLALACASCSRTFLMHHAVAPSSCIMQSHLPHASCSRTFLMHHAVAPSSCIMQSHMALGAFVSDKALEKVCPTCSRHLSSASLSFSCLKSVMMRFRVAMNATLLPGTTCPCKHHSAHGFCLHCLAKVRQREGESHALDVSVDHIVSPA